MSSSTPTDNFFTVKQVNSMAQSNVGSKITKPVYFKVLSDRDLKHHNVLVVGDSESDQMEIEFDAAVLQDMAKKSKFLFPTWRSPPLSSVFVEHYDTNWRKILLYQNKIAEFDKNSALSEEL